MKRTKRRTYIVNKPLQRSILRAICWPLFIVCVIAVVLQWQFGAHLTEEAARVGVPIFGVGQMLFATGVFFVYAMIVQVLIGIKVSHRIAGAAYRISRTLEAVQGGDPEMRAKLRKGDLLTDLADDVNRFLSWSEERDPKGSGAPAKSPAGTPAASSPAGNPARPAAPAAESSTPA